MERKYTSRKSYVLPTFPAYLQGMESRQDLLMVPSSRRFPAYLQGMERLRARVDHARGAQFPAYLQGMERGRPEGRKTGGQGFPAYLQGMERDEFPFENEEVASSQPTYKEWKFLGRCCRTARGTGSQPTYKEWK